jgi:dual specificity MAP kinase phosphatase
MDNDLPYNEIIDYLFVGSARALQHATDFSMIINVTLDIPFPKKHANCIRIPIDDDPENIAKFSKYMEETKILDKIHNEVINKLPVLVHCYAGSQRSCSLVAYYLIKYYGMTSDAAIEYIISKRPEAFYGGIHLQPWAKN